MPRPGDPADLPDRLAIHLVLLDRDGVLNRNLARGVRSEADWIWLPGAADAVRLIARSARVMILTNQANIGRGLLKVGQLTAIHRRMLSDLDIADLTIGDILYCPHRPDDGCHCRKPKTGLALAALRRAEAEAEHTIMIGDHESDIETAAAAGCWSLHVRTGRGQRPAAGLPRYLGSVTDLRTAARMVVRACAR